MSLVSNLTTAFTRVGTEFKSIRTLIGGSGTADISGLNTTAKTSLVSAINEVNLKVPAAPAAATETAAGIVELATVAETTTGTDAVRAVTPAGVKAATDAVRTAILGSGVPAALDTLDELAAALGDDANFASTVTNGLAGKQPIDPTLTALAGVTTAANTVIYATAADTFTTTSLTAFARSLLDDADAATARGTLAVYSTTEIGDPTTDFAAGFVAALA